MSRDMQSNKIDSYEIYSLSRKYIFRLIAFFLFCMFIVLPSTGDYILFFSVSVPFKISILEDAVIILLGLQPSRETIFVQILQRR